MDGFSVESLAIFGSVARNEATDGSDIDVLVRFKKGKPIGLFEFVRFQRFLSDILGCPVDLVTPEALRKRCASKFSGRPSMPPRDWRLRISDILEAITRIDLYTSGMNFALFAKDEKTVDAVVRNITVIGEAARSVPPIIVDAHPEIPWQDMCDMRNVVVHAYFGLNRQILWDTIQTNLQPLIPLLQNILKESK